MRKIFVITIFILSFSVFAKAQDIPNYLFVEVIDSNQKPLKDATVSLISPAWDVVKNKQETEKGVQTDGYGKVYYFLPHIGNDFSKSLFKITKDGYFDFLDFGVPMRPRERVVVKIELLKIPANDDEKKSLGNEQSKREFLWAAKKGDSEVVRKFLKTGMNSNLSTNDLHGVSEPKNIPVILFAVSSGKVKTVEILLKAGANVRSKVEPLHSILATYLKANPFLKKESGSDNDHKISLLEFQGGIKSLIKAGAATNKLLESEQTALIVAAQLNDAETIKLLLNIGISGKDKAELSSALMQAVNLYGSNQAGFSPIKVVEVLLKTGADPNFAYNPTADYNCSSVMMDAIWGGDLKVVKLLIDYKADVNFTCKNGDTALKWAKTYSVVSPQNQQEMIKLLKESGAK